MATDCAVENLRVTLIVLEVFEHRTVVTPEPAVHTDVEDMEDGSVMIRMELFHIGKRG